MGVALTSCTVPAAGKPTFELGDDEMELGVGIHGEPGRERRAAGARPGRSPRCWSSRSWPTCRSRAATACIAFVNGLGGTPLIELYLMYNEVDKILGGHGISVARSLVGPYITSLDMAGTSVTLLKVDDELLSLWDAPVRTPGLRWGALTRWPTVVDVSGLRPAWVRGFADCVAEQRDDLTDARLRHRRRRPRHPTWTAGMQAAVAALAEADAGDAGRAARARSA